MVRFVRLPQNAMTLLRLSAIFVFPLLLAACTSIQRGVVITKGSSLTTTGLTPRPMFWVDVRGANADGEVVIERVNLFEWDWTAMKQGDQISPADYGLCRFMRPAVRPEIAEPVIPAPPPRLAKSKRARGAKSARVAAQPPRESKPPTPPPAMTAEVRAARFREIEAKAIEDPQVREMKQKIHAVSSDEEQAQALKQYRKGVFEKMRALDSSLHDLIDRAEAGGTKDAL